MTEYVQVPVSLIKGLRDALAEHDDPHCEVDNYASDQAYISHVDALLSQPTLTNTTDCTCDWHMTMRDPDPSCPVHSSKDAA